jgi:hypothetical protein
MFKNVDCGGNFETIVTENPNLDFVDNLKKNWIGATRHFENGACVGNFETIVI